MCNDYDDDDFELDTPTIESDWIELGSSEMDIYDFDDKLEIYLSEIDTQIKKTQDELVQALTNKEDPDRIERLEDELSLLIIDYQRFEV
jgi:hypothetical protein